MSETGEAKPPNSDRDSDRATDERKDVDIAVVAGEAVATVESVAIEILDRAETEFKERERGDIWPSRAAAALTAIASVVTALTAFAKDLSVVLAIIAGVVGAALAAALAAWGFSPEARDLFIFRRSRLPEPDLPPGLRALRDELALERRDALARLDWRVADPTED